MCLEFENPYEALMNVFLVELSWGGVIDELSETRVVIKTRIFHLSETTVIEGPTEEMKNIFGFANVYSELSGKNGQLIDAKVDECLKSMAQNMGGKVEFMTPLFKGNYTCKVALMAICGISAEDEVRAGLTAENEVFISAIVSSLGGRPFKEALIRPVCS
jgi:hypothetical protein